MRLIFVVDGKPVPCQRARVTKHGHAYTPAATRIWQNEVKMSATGAMKHAEWEAGSADEFAVDITIYRKVNRGDIDNYTKSVLDGITKAGVWADDRYVRKLNVEIVSSDHERTVVNISNEWEKQI